MNCKGKWIQRSSCADQRTLEAVKAKRSADAGSHLRETIISMLGLVIVYEAAGMADQAVQLLDEMFDGIRNADPSVKIQGDLLSEFNRLGLWYQRKGKWDLSVSVLEQTLETMKPRLKPEDRYLFNLHACRHNLVNAYAGLERFDKSLPLAEETVNAWTAFQGRDHGNTLMAAGNLAGMYCRVGRFGEGLLLGEEIVKLSEAKYGPAHPRTLSTKDQLAGIYLDAGKLDLAPPEPRRRSRRHASPSSPMTQQVIKERSPEHSFCRDGPRKGCHWPSRPSRWRRKNSVQ